MVFLHKCWIIFLCFLLVVSVIHCSVNLAAGQITSQSSNSNGSTGSGRAVDGSYTGFCAVTNRDNEAFWLVKLAATSVITRVRLVFDLEVSQETRYLREYTIYISNDDNPETGNVCYRESRTAADIDPVKHEASCYDTGKYVSMYTNRRLNGIALIGVCEVEVFGCQVGYYGTTCSDKCSENCKTLPCEPDFGRCIDGCKPGFSGEKCDTGCPEGFYGSACTNRCSVNCKDQVCNPDNGECTNACNPGYIGDMCDTKCTNGTYGTGCTFNCSTTCVNSVCDYVNGTCERCVDGYIGNQCSFLIPVVSGPSDPVSTDDSSTMFIIVTGVLAAVLFVLIVVFVGFMIMSKQKTKSSVTTKIGKTPKSDKHPLSRADTLNKEYDDMLYAIPSSPSYQQSGAPVLEYEDPVSRSNDKRNMQMGKSYPNTTFREINGSSRALPPKPQRNTQQNTGLVNKGELRTYEGLQMDQIGKEKNVYDDLG